MFQASLQVGKHMSLAGHSPKSTSYQLEPCLEMPGQPAATAQYISIRHLTRIPGTCASPLFKLIHWQQKRKKKIQGLGVHLFSFSFYGLKEAKSLRRDSQLRNSQKGRLVCE